MNRITQIASELNKLSGRFTEIVAIDTWYNQIGGKEMSDKMKGLYAKYHVERINDPKEKHDNCFFFVLDIDHDIHARIALREYALSCKKDYPKLSEDLFNAVSEKEV